MPASSEVRESEFRGAIFDVDGVLVDSPHERAWRESLRDLMEGEWSEIRAKSRWTPEAFTSRVYREEVSGKPRLAGARAALAYFQIPDDAQQSRLTAYAERKQNLVTRLIEAGDFHLYLDALRFLVAIKDAGLVTAAASSSKNASLLLTRIRIDRLIDKQLAVPRAATPAVTLLDLFDVDVSGRDFEHGKPHPEMFLAATNELGIKPRHAIVMEDAVAGVQAAKAGGMSAIGIARAGDVDLLAEAGADLVVTTLEDVDLVALAAGRLEAH